MKEITKTVAMAAVISTTAVSVCLVAMGHGRWAAGVWVAVIWSVVNFSLVLRILEASILKDTKTNIGRILLVKFPVLYLAGFWILNTRVFPPISLAAGMGITVLIIGVVNVWPKRA
jgi:hypothetical protein